MEREVRYGYKKPGRDKKELDEQLIFDLAAIQCTLKEIASIAKCCTHTLTDNYQEVIDQGRESGKQRLRRSQWISAVEDKVPAMQIWLGKIYLGQRDLDNRHFEYKCAAQEIQEHIKETNKELKNEQGDKPND